MLISIRNMRMSFLKPLHGWRAFVGEVGVIVLGVVIALLAQGAVEDLQWRKQAKLATEGFQQELGAAALSAYERAALQPCLQGRIRELSNAIARSEGRWPAARLDLQSAAYRNAMPVAYRAPFRVILTDAWDNALASGTLNHLPAERVATLSGTYKQVAQLSDLQEQEQRASAALAPLAFDSDLDPQLRADALRQLAELDRLNALMAVMGSQLIESVRDLRLGFPASEVEAARKQLIAEQTEIRGTCVRSLPLDLNGPAQGDG